VESVHVASRVTGYLTNAAFKEGTDVKKGDLLFEIDPRPYQALVDQAQAEVRLHETRMAAARADLDRAKDLAKSATVSREELDKFQAAEQEAAAALDAAKANLQSHELNLGFCRIVSPIDGRAGRYNLTAGNLVTQDQTELTTIVSLDPIYAVFNMDERTLLRIRKANNESKLKQLESGGAAPVFLRVQGEDDFSHQGTVNFVSNQIDSSTGTVLVRAVLANPRPKDGVELLSPGMFVTVRLPIGQPHRALLVAESALTSHRGVRNLFVVDSDDKVQLRDVRVGAIQDDGLRVIQDGLKPDDRVIVGRNEEIQAGLKIAPRVVPMPATRRGSSTVPETGDAPK
jgi:multidrug efflux system membrane fusion protein